MFIVGHDHRNLQKLATEMYKIKNSIAPTLMQELFPKYANPYNLRNNRCWQAANVRTVGYGIETLLFQGQKTWCLLPESLKTAKTLTEFKKRSKAGFLPVAHADSVKLLLADWVSFNPHFFIFFIIIIAFNIILTLLSASLFDCLFLFRLPVC